MKKRVVITGLGAVTPLGNDVPAFWNSMLAARSGVGLMKAETSDEILPVYVAAVKDFAPEKIGLPRRKLKMMGRAAQLMLAASAEASRDAGLVGETMENLAERCGMVVGAGMLNAEILELSSSIKTAQNSLADKPDAIDVETFSRAAAAELFPLWLLRYIPNMVAAHAGIFLQTRAASNTVMNGCASAAFAVGEAARIIRRGEADVMLAGGVDARISTLAMLRYLELGWQTKETTQGAASVSKPFDRDAQGFVSGEAAGVIVLEDYEHARRRGARIFAEILNCGAGNDAFDVLHPHPQGRGLNRAVANCLKPNGKELPAPELVFAAANGIPEYDAATAAALKNSFENFNFNPKVTATRSLLGHTHAASFALDAIAAVKSINESIAPPTLNLANPIADFDFIGSEGREMPVSSVLVTGYGFAGHAGALLLRRCE
ncbi:MAG: beta-ketoacyl-[acyl-carrier-protein] synthase family protein [Pyrinomonadaceae bacterium]